MSQLLPGSIIGIIGGHEQASSIALAAKQRGYIVYCYRQATEPAVSYVSKEVIDHYHHREALFAFAAEVDTLLVMTNLLELDMLYALSSRSRYYQSFELAEIAQNAVVEKLFLEEHAINVAPYGVVTSVGELPMTLSSIGFPALLTPNHVQQGNPQVMILDHEMDESVLQMIEDQSCMLTAFVAAKRHFSLTVIRDYEDRVNILPITEDIYIGNQLKYSIASKRMNPEWVGELRTIAGKVIRSLTGSVLATIHVILADNGIFYVTQVDQLPVVQHQFSSRQIQHSMSEIVFRLATGLPILTETLTKEAVMVPIYPTMLEQARVLTVLKPEWEFEYFVDESAKSEVIGVIRLSGASSVDLVNELELSGLHDRINNV